MMNVLFISSISNILGSAQ